MLATYEQANCFMHCCKGSDKNNRLRFSRNYIKVMYKFQNFEKLRSADATAIGLWEPSTKCAVLLLHSKHFIQSAAAHPSE